MSTLNDAMKNRKNAVKTRAVLAAAVLASVTVMAGNAHAAAVVWTGTTNNAWATGTNWSGGTGTGGIPGTTDTVTIGVATNNPVLIGSNRTVGSLTVNSGSTLNFNAGAAVAAASGFTNAGTLQISWLSGTVGTSGSTALTNTGTIQVDTGAIFQHTGATAGTTQILTNTGGTINVLGTGKFQFKGTQTVLGGTLNVASTGAFQMMEKVATGTFKNMTSNIDGAFRISNFGLSAAGDTRAKVFIIDGGTLNANGLSSINNNDLTLNPSVVNQANALTLTATNSAVVNIGSAGTMNIVNNNSRTSTNTGGTAAFVLDSGVKLTNNGIVNLSNTSNTSAATAAGTQPALIDFKGLTADLVNNGTINISNTATSGPGGSNSSKLQTASSFNNVGNITVAGTNASVNVTGTFTQEVGTGSVYLTNSGQLVASTGVVLNGGTLGGATGGKVVGAVTVNNTGNVAPGATGVGSVGTLDITGNVVFGNGSNLEIDLTGNTIDKLAIAGGLDLSSSTDKVTFSLSGTQTLSRYVFATYTGSLSGNQFNTQALPAGMSVDYSVANEIAVMIPEPTTGLMVAGLMGMSLLGRRRSRVA